MINKKLVNKIAIQFIITEICSILFGILLGMEGAQYSGKFMVTKFMGNDGWQAGFAFYGLIGISLGGYIGAVLSTKILHTTGSFLAGFLVSLLVYAINVMPYDHGIAALGAIQLYLLPAIGATIGINWYLLRPKNNRKK